MTAPESHARDRSVGRRRRRRFLSGILLLLVAGGIAGTMPRRAAPVGDHNATAQLDAYVVPWDEDAGLASVASHHTKLRQLNPAWYGLTADGDIERTTDTPTDELREIARKHHLSFVPSIANTVEGEWDGATVSRLLNNDERRTDHVTRIVELAIAQHWDGVDIDYEFLRPEDRDAFSAFVSELATELGRHELVLSVAVHARTDEGVDDFRAAHDYAAIGEAADQVRLMSYDHHWNGSGPGPMAPAAWVDEIVTHALTLIPANKLSLGIAAYGYDWGPEGGTALTWVDAQRLATQHKADVRWVPAATASTFTYTDADGRHEVWFEDARSVAAKLTLIAEHEIGGAFIWRLGGEDPGIWDELTAGGPTDTS